MNKTESKLLSMRTVFALSSLLLVSSSHAQSVNWDFNDATTQGWTLSYLRTNGSTFGAANPVAYPLTAAGQNLTIDDDAIVSLYADPGALFFTMPSTNLSLYEGGTLGFDIRADVPGLIGLALYTSDNDFVVISGSIGGVATKVAAPITYSKDGNAHRIEVNLTTDNFYTNYQYQGGILALLFDGNGSTSGSSLSASDFSELLSTATGLYVGTYNAALGVNVLGVVTLDSASISSLDNITLTALPEPSSYGIVAGTILLGTVALRRRKSKR